ncbi:MAG: hypothetical protein EPN22_05140 [Nitrospirae bacterium]|nr:MAG: hypothetical protein EPN22_05140 [Nitrospirota bacterium]
MKKLFIAFLLVFVTALLGCIETREYTRMSLNIDKIDKEAARSEFVDRLINQQISQLRIRGLMPIKYDMATRFQNGELKFVGVKNTRDENGFVFLFERTHSAILTRERLKDLAAYSFIFGNNPTMIFYEMKADAQNSAKYAMTLTDVEFCMGVVRNEPFVDNNRLHVEFGNSSGEGRPFNCDPTLNFDSQQSLYDFAKVFISAFPKVRVMQ